MKSKGEEDEMDELGDLLDEEDVEQLLNDYYNQRDMIGDRRGEIKISDSRKIFLEEFEDQKFLNSFLDSEVEITGDIGHELHDPFSFPK